ncbi:hypothetical protein HN011_012217 [Eciton burchellii]|nr:hypothetical protein HN011_012217 [Eciton burchellii]
MNNRPSVCFFVANAHTLLGLITWMARDIETATSIKDNQGLDQSKGQHRRIDGCSRKPISSGSQLSNKGLKQASKTNKENEKKYQFGAVSFLDDHGRSSRINSDDRTTL